MTDFSKQIAPESGGFFEVTDVRVDKERCSVEYDVRYLKQPILQFTVSIDRLPGERSFEDLPTAEDLKIDCGRPPHAR